jgi:hypothetical protein
MRPHHPAPIPPASCIPDSPVDVLSVRLHGPRPATLETHPGTLFWPQTPRRWRTVPSRPYGRIQQPPSLPPSPWPRRTALLFARLTFHVDFFHELRRWREREQILVQRRVRVEGERREGQSSTRLRPMWIGLSNALRRVASAGWIGDLKASCRAVTVAGVCADLEPPR